MKNKVLHLAFLGFALTQATLFCTNKSNAKTAAYTKITPSDNCNCEDNWFPKAQTPAHDEGDGSPFDI